MSNSRYKMAQTGNSFNSGACTEEVFDIKGLILKYVDRGPGIRYRELLRLTGLVNGTLEYHLKTLERTHRVKVLRWEKSRLLPHRLPI